MKIAVIGLGYVGLPLAIAFSKNHSVIGYDISEKRVRELELKNDITGETTEAELKEYVDTGSKFTLDVSELREASVFIVTVPTPVDEKKQPDLGPLIEATQLVAKNLKRGDCVVYESTVYPGTTDEICRPILEKISKFKACEDFHYGYSPERINPGDKNQKITDIVKVTSGCCEIGATLVDDLYSSVIGAGTFLAENIKTAEAAKVIENTQRDVNIALMNELSEILNSMNINTNDVLKAASTKWNFLRFTPGLVGGHCIGVDPYYLIHKSKSSGVAPRLLEISRTINNEVPQRIVSAIRYKYHISPGAKILVKGLTFKENCSDTRNSQVLTLVNMLSNLEYDVTASDPLLKENDLELPTGVRFENDPNKEFYDLLILAVAHDQYRLLTAEEHKNCLREHGIFMDLKSVYDKSCSDFQL